MATQDELEKIIGEHGKQEDPTPPAPSGDDKKPPAGEKSDEEKKQEQLKNLDVAIKRETAALQQIRDDKKKEIAGGKPADDTPKIDLDDPSSKAWDKHIKQEVAPVTEEIEKEKQEILKFALKDYLVDKPEISNDPEKFKSFLQTYDAVKRNSGRTKEGVIEDLSRAYGAEFHDTIPANARRVEQARERALESDAGVSSGVGGYNSSAPKKKRQYSQSDLEVLARWGMTPDQHSKIEVEMNEKMPK